MIKLKEGQKLIGEDGNTYLIEKGDVIQEKLLKEAVNLWDNTYKSYDGRYFVYFNGDSYSIEVIDARKPDTIFIEFDGSTPLSNKELSKFGLI